MITKYSELRIGAPDEVTGLRNVTEYQLFESYDDIGELLDTVNTNGFEFMELGDALRDDRFVRLGARDIRLYLTGEHPDYIYAVSDNGRISYFGIKAVELEEDEKK